MRWIGYFLSSVIVLLFSCPSSGQEVDKRSPKCDCEVAFQDMITKLERNYIGLEQLQIAGKEEDYTHRKIEYTGKAAQVLPENCALFLDEFLSYFKDGHLHVVARPAFSESEVLRYKKQIKNNRLDKADLEKRIAEHKTDRSNVIVGSWTDGVSEFVVFKTENEYRAYVAETTKDGIEPGELKAIFRPADTGFTGTYYSYGYSPVYIRGDVYKDGQLLVAGGVFWKRVEPTFNLSITETGKLKEPTLDIINPKTTLLTIPSFSHDFTFFNDFIKKNELLLKSSRNLIIDIRGNRGGNGVYFPLIELFATSNMHSSQGLVLASLDNRAYFDQKTSYAKKIYKPVVERMDEHMGEIVDGPFYPEKTFKIRDNLIQRVAILTDHGSASAAESFIIHSKRSSSKVTTFGAPTAGMIDYTSVTSLLLNSGEQKIYFVYPTSTLHKFIPRHGFNKTGILPDVPIGNEVKDKLDFIVRFYQK